MVDRLPLPFLTRYFGRRRAWLLLAQLAIILSIISMALTDPQQGGNTLTIMAIGAVALGFSSATQDIVIDAYRIESAGSELQAMMSSTYIAGYRIGMLVSGAGALILAGYWGSTRDAYVYEAWRNSYLIMAAAMLVGIVTSLVIAEPKRSAIKFTDDKLKQYLGFLTLFALSVVSLICAYVVTDTWADGQKAYWAEAFHNKALATVLIETLRLAIGVVAAGFTAWLCILVGIAQKSMVEETYIDPIRDFFSRYGMGIALLLLSIIGLYRISDIVLGVVSNLFYQDIGYTKNEIAGAVKSFGLLMTIVGGLAGGMFAIRFGLMRILIIGAVLSAGTNLLFLALAHIGYNLPALYVVIAVDNLSAGLASAAFVAFLSSLTNISFTAMQYAIFSSLMTLVPKVFGGYSGSIVDSVGYESFFLITTLMGLPVLVLLIIAAKKIALNQPAMA
jgi:PAT family beta-lactamase induction signal transducer AmpG